MEKKKEISVVFAIGAAGYPILELLWRRHTHWTMVLAGGVCFLVLYMLDTRCKKMKLWKKCALGAAAVTSIEFLVGCVVNLMLNWDVWNYSCMPGNLLGQVCPLFSALWGILCLPVDYLCNAIRNRLCSTAGRDNSPGACDALSIA